MFDTIPQSHMLVPAFHKCLSAVLRCLHTKGYFLAASGCHAAARLRHKMPARHAILPRDSLGEAKRRYSGDERHIYIALAPTFLRRLGRYAFAAWFRDERVSRYAEKERGFLKLRPWGLMIIQMLELLPVSRCRYALVLISSFFFIEASGV